MREFIIIALFIYEVVREWDFLSVFLSGHANIQISFVCVSPKSVPFVLKRRQLVVFVSLVPTRITFAGYVIVISGA